MLLSMFFPRQNIVVAVGNMLMGGRSTRIRNYKSNFGYVQSQTTCLALKQI